MTEMATLLPRRPVSRRAVCRRVSAVLLGRWPWLVMWQTRALPPSGGSAPGARWCGRARLPCPVGQREQLADRPVVVGVLAVLHGEDPAVAFDQEVGGKAEAAAVRVEARGRVAVGHDSPPAGHDPGGGRRPGARLVEPQFGRLDAELGI